MKAPIFRNESVKGVGYLRVSRSVHSGVVSNAVLLPTFRCVARFTSAVACSVPIFGYVQLNRVFVSANFQFAINVYYQ